MEVAQTCAQWWALLLVVVNFRLLKVTVVAAGTKLTNEFSTSFTMCVCVCACKSLITESEISKPPLEKILSQFHKVAEIL
jgi:hypothetical protein